MPIAPWQILEHDPWKSQGVRFLPFHAYLRHRLYTCGCQGKHPYTERCPQCGTLPTPSFRQKEGCRNHAPWPQGICSDCQPDSARLSMQRFRHVDHVEFECADIVDEFLAYWRATGLQRCGYLVGRYVPDEFMPLGVRAVVSAIYEPPQHCTMDVAVVDYADPSVVAELAVVDALAAEVGMERVGFVWSALVTDPHTRQLVASRMGVGVGVGAAANASSSSSSSDGGPQGGKAEEESTRGERDNGGDNGGDNDGDGDNDDDGPLEPLIVTSSEIVRMAQLQNAFPNRCAQSRDNRFGSKFVSVLATADGEGQISLHALQVSNQCAAMVRDQLVTASADPALMRVRTSKTGRYIPDVIYADEDADDSPDPVEGQNNNNTNNNANNTHRIRSKKASGAAVLRTAKSGDTFPPHFFLVRLNRGMPIQPSPTFRHHGRSSKRQGWSVENRPLEALSSSSSCSLAAAKAHVLGTSDEAAVVAHRASDFHWLAYVHAELLRDSDDSGGGGDNSGAEKAGIVRAAARLIVDKTKPREVQALLRKALEHVTVEAESASSSSGSGSGPAPAPGTSAGASSSSGSNSGSSSSSSSSSSSASASGGLTASQRESLDTMVAMGFDAGASRQALAQVGWNVENALAIIMG
jgi:NPL4 family/NPL4 family, putative zinc binding region/UBA/TS-N domain